MHARSWLSLVVLLGCVASVVAQPYGYGSGTMPGDPAMPTSPGAGGADRQAAMGARMARDPARQASATLKEGMDKLLGYLAQEEVPNQLQVAAFLDREIAPYFDFDSMARWVAGPAYAQMSAKDREALAAHVESSFLSTLASELVVFQGQQIRMLPPSRGPRGAISVNVGVMRPGTYPSKLQFRMYPTDSGWKVYDVTANGQSAAAYYRVEFQRMAMQRAPYGR